MKKSIEMNIWTLQLQNDFFQLIQCTFSNNRNTIILVRLSLREIIMSTIAYFISDHGLGHATRSVAIIRSLLECDLVISINIHTSKLLSSVRAGVGGHCLPKDPWLLRYGAMKYGSYFREPEFISLGRRINDHMPVYMVGLISAAFEKHHLEFRESVITILGIAYLEDSDDIRNTPARTVISLLKSRNAEIRLHDPYIGEHDGVSIEKNIWKAVNQSDCIVIITKHSPNDFRG